MRGLGAAAALLAFLVVLPGQAEAVEAPKISFANASATEGGDVTFTISRTGTEEDLLLPSTITATTSDVAGEAVAPADYAAKTETIVFLSTETTKQFVVSTVDDDIDEDDEDFKVTLASVENATIPESEKLGTIVDGDATPAVAISGAPTVVEGGTASFTVTIAGKSENTITVNYAPENVTATAGSDYTLPPGQLQWTSGDTSTRPIDVATTNDTLDEADTETFRVNLSGGNATITSSTATGTITDNDNPPSVTIGDVVVTEGNSGTLSATFTVTLSAASGRTVSVNWATAAGTAGADDFESASGTLTILAGDTSGTISVAVKGDTISEPEEQFFVNIFGPSNATLGAKTQGKATITDNDVAPVINSINDPTVAEGNADVTVNFLVTLSAVSSAAVTVKYSTADGTAKAGEDYVSVQNATLTIPANTTSISIPITVKGDLVAEAEEFFFVNLFPPTTNATLGGDTQGRATITDSDPVPVPTVAPGSVTEGNAGPGSTNLVFQVTLSGPRPQTTFNYRTVAGSANSSDYTEVGGAQLVFQAKTDAGATTLPITIKVNGDTLDENNESFTLQLLNPTSGAVVASATGTIVNDDNNSKLSISDSTADEPSTGTATMKFTVTLSAASGRTVSVNWATADGTATAGVDYTPGSGALSFGPGDTSKEIVVSVTGDEINEENETVLVNITGAGVTDAQGQGTIVDKNAPPSLSISDTVARENGSGAEFTVTLAGTTLRTVTVRFSTSDGTAKAGTDYVARVGTLTFASGEKTKAIAVTVVDDTVAESAETFFVGLGDPVNATITKKTGAASIEASDQAPTTPKLITTPPVVKPVVKSTTLLPRMLLGPRTVTIAAAGVARMLVTCHKASPIACSGSVALETVAKPKFQLGKKTFSVKKGKKVYVPIKLSARGLKRLALKGTLQVKAIVVVKTGAKTLRVVPGVITLKLKPGTKFKAPAVDVIIDSP